jgi:lipid II:glycine glycyltransferase (peptidoglycan interpeptide bridge formation enzyme)
MEMLRQSETYRKTAVSETPSGTLESWQSNQVVDNQWDLFLTSLPFAHFYQSCMWAQVRTLDGWQPLLTIITLNGEIIGGFMTLWRSKSFLGKIGLVLKGPVINSKDPLIHAFAVTLLKKTAKREGFQALIVQPPDNNEVTEAHLKTSGISENKLDYVIKTNTVRVDLRDSEIEIFKRIKSKKRYYIRRAEKCGVKIQEGGRDDLQLFFNFMVETCKRQQVKPSPSRYEFLSSMWDLFSPSGHMKVFFAQCEDENISGYVVVPFNKTVYLWKFGWSGNYGRNHPNELLYWEIFRWAKNNGYLFADLDAISPSLAESTRLGLKPCSYDAQTYSRFKNEFGGNVISLSRGYVYLPNPLVRWGYDLLMPFINRTPCLKQKLLFQQ